MLTRKPLLTAEHAKHGKGEPIFLQEFAEEAEMGTGLRND